MTGPGSPREKSHRKAAAYAAWIAAHSAAILAVTAAAVAISLLLALLRLPLHTDFASLLPEESAAVRELNRLGTRAPAHGTVLVLVVADDPHRRALVAQRLLGLFSELPRHLVARMETDDAETRAYVRANLPLFVSLDELVAARDALAERIRREKLAANPLYIDLEDEPGEAGARLSELRDRRRQKERELAKSGFVSSDGKVQLIVLRTAFSKTSLALALELRRRLGDIRQTILRDSGSDADVGFAGDVMTALAERDGVLRGMAGSAAVTMILVLALLWGYYRSTRLVTLLVLTLATGVALTFGLAAIAIGHLNLATAFLGAIVAGNGVNYGILFMSRYTEERRRDPDADAMRAVATAMGATARPTIIASLGASIAYGSLAVTSFRGFTQFAFIGATGMVICWIASFTTLPALLLRFDRDHDLRTRPALAPMRRTVELLASAPRRLAGIAAAGLAIAAAVASYRYVAGDPFEYNLNNLKSRGPAAMQVQSWMLLSDRNFGRGISGATYLAAENREQMAAIIDALRAIDRGKPKEERLIGSIHSMEDVLPRNQEKKLEVLAAIRDLLDSDVLAQLSENERRELEELRPPASLRVLKESDLPAEVIYKLRERDGRVGLLVAVRPADRLNAWDGRDLIQFAAAIRRLELADGSIVATSGSSVIFADIIARILVDGPRATAVSAAAVLLLVLLLVGVNRRALVIVACTSLGTLTMIATAAALGIRVNFLDFVALPITIGLGVDYAVNIAHAQAVDRRTVQAASAAVFVCALTTIIAYGSLLISDNQAVRSFGMASLIGEICCVLAALVLVPALLNGRLGHRGRDPGPQPGAQSFDRRS